MVSTTTELIIVKENIHSQIKIPQKNLQKLKKDFF
jgi:hypothetical protein